jgi:hypothetical protein
MLLYLPEDLLLSIITLVATSSMRDLLQLRRTCKGLNMHCLNEKILKCCALEMSLSRYLNIPDGYRDYFYQLLESSRNPNFCFRMGILNIRYRTPNYVSARHFLDTVVPQGHDRAKYKLAILNIFPVMLSDMAWEEHH